MAVVNLDDPSDVAAWNCRAPAPAPAPTDADIIALADETRTGEPGREGYILPISFARAVLAKWGTPAPVSQPVAAPAQAAPCHCTNPWAHDQCTDSPGCKIKNKLTKASQPVAATAGMDPVARIEGIDEYGPRIEWTQHWVDVGVGAKLYTESQVQAMLAAIQSLTKEQK